MKILAILGASGHGRVVADIAERNGWEQIVFFDDQWPNKKNNYIWPIVGNTNSLLSRIPEYDGIIVGIGNNKVRASKHYQLKQSGAQLVTLVHPSATVSQHASIGIGSVVVAGAIVNVCSQVGEGAVLNTASTVGHDCILGDFVHVAPGANLAGGTEVGSYSWIGVGSCTKQSARIGESALVGSGAAVIDYVPDGVTVVGVPARPLHL